MDKKSEISVLIPKPLAELPENLQNWVSSFAAYLGILLDRIIPDHGLISVENELKKSGDDKMVIFLISPDFVADEGYMRVIQKLSDQENKRMTNASVIAQRIFKVCIMPIATGKQPDFMHEYTDYQICQTEIDADDLLFDTGIKSPVWSVLVDLAYDIAGSVLDSSDVESTTQKDHTGPTLFLAETTSDQLENRNALRRELIQFGFTVVPHKHLSGDAAEIEKTVNDLIKEASSAIHIVGNEYGDPLQGSEYSLLDLQLRLSSEAGDPTDLKEDFQRIIWFPPDQKPTDEKHEMFLEKLVRQEETMKVAEIVQTPLELLKSIVRKKISGKDKKSRSDPKVTLPEKPFVYLIHEEKFENEIEPVISWFREQNTEMIWSGMMASSENIVSLHRQYLSNCSGVLIHYSGDNIPWISSKMKDLLKAPGFGRTEPIKAMAVMVQNGNKFESMISNVDVYQIKKGTSEMNFDNFLEKINQ